VSSSHPVHLLGVREDENKLIDNTIRPDRPANQFQSRVIRIIEDKVIEVKVT
jgi:hypothetical protein